MLITFIDDSISFTGDTPDKKAIGSSEKCVARFAGALAKRGYTVRVFNKIQNSIVENGIAWFPISKIKTINSDILIVHQNPQLFSYVSSAKKKVLWLTSKTSLLESKKNIYFVILCQGE